VLALLVLLAGGSAAFLLARSSGESGSTGAQGGTTTGTATRIPSTASVSQTPQPKPKPLVAVKVASASSLDPSGDGSENQGSAPLAVDGSQTTLWSTETYKGTRNVNGKPGVGLVLDLTKVTTVTRLRLSTPLPGWTARIYETGQTTAPATLDGWQAISKSFTMSTPTRIVPLRGPPARMLLIWITDLAGPDGEWSAKISEATPLIQQQ
jgi:putative peptidoglycan lipid II flippase